MQGLLEYPFDAALVLKKKKSIRRWLKEENKEYIKKNIAILGGSTTSEVKDILELFLLNYGIEPVFYESEYGQFWQDAVFGNAALDAFGPDLVYIHTSNRNILNYPAMENTPGEAEEILLSEYRRFYYMWEKLREKYRCPIIQNNFEMPFYRLLGNKEASDIHGKIYFLTRLNLLFYEYAQSVDGFYINDINYLSASYGLEHWSEPKYWYMYKYCLCIPAIPYLAFNLSNIIKSVYGKNKKALVLDLDNTLWGNIIGEDGTGGIEIGHETPMGQAYSEFQGYIKGQKSLGVILAINSKNEMGNALAGLHHPDSILCPDDFIVIKANWEPKDRNFLAISKELNILPDSMVFLDDSPTEREIVRRQVPGAAVPELNSIEGYIRIVDRSGFFEQTVISEDDVKRNVMYQQNRKREELGQSFQNYGDFLRSLKMEAVIREFEPVYYARIAQLTNKSNQFNLTTKRFTEAEISGFAAQKEYICLYGKLSDKFGDNGVVTVVIGRQEEEVLHIELWLMSCRVLKRGMEDAMLDELVKKAGRRGICRLKGYYYKTAKNAMVKDFYQCFGFKKLSENTDGDSEWILELVGYQEKNHRIKITN